MADSGARVSGPTFPIPFSPGSTRFIRGMAQFTGRLQSQSLIPTTVWMDIGEGRLRISAGRRHIGSWSLEGVEAERTSIYKFSLDIDGEKFEFYPDDPSTFSDSIGAIIDLTESKGRFGLRRRIEQTYT